MSDGLGFLISDVARLLRRRFDDRARAIGVTRAQWRALTTLNRHEGMNQGALAELLEVEPITLCRMIDRLAEAGLVERRRDPDDRRAWLIFLTDRARPIIGQLREIADGMVDAALEGLSGPEIAALERQLGTIRSNLIQTVETKAVGHG